MLRVWGARDKPVLPVSERVVLPQVRVCVCRRVQLLPQPGRNALAAVVKLSVCSVLIVPLPFPQTMSGGALAQA